MRAIETTPAPLPGRRRKRFCSTAAVRSDQLPLFGGYRGAEKWLRAIEITQPPRLEEIDRTNEGTFNLLRTWL